MYMTAGGLTLIGIFAMRWNVVIGGQLFSKSFLGYTTYKMDLVTREGLLPAIVLMLLPFVIFLVLVKLLPPWQERKGSPKPEEVAMPQPDWEALERESRDLAKRWRLEQQRRRCPRLPRRRSAQLAEFPSMNPAGAAARCCGRRAAGTGRRLPAARAHRIRRAIPPAWGVAAGIVYALFWLGLGGAHARPPNA